MMRFIKTVFCFLLLCGSARAQVQPEYEKVLLPIAIKHPGRIIIQGAYGSQWTTEFSLVNRGDQPVLILGYASACQADPCVPDPRSIPPDVTLYPPLIAFGGQQQQQHGYLLRVERNRVNNVHFLLRVLDLSRQSQTWGTQIPVVRESEALSSTTNLLDVPSRPEFRSMLRVYDFDARSGAAVTVRLYGVNRTNGASPDELLASTTLNFRTHPPGNGIEFAGYADLLLSQLPETFRFERLRVEIEPVTLGLRYWAFISVTNNETQHVTTVTPQ